MLNSSEMVRRIWCQPTRARTAAEARWGTPLDKFIRDPAGEPPLCDEEEFAGLVKEMVAEEAPQLFAVVQEYGDRVDAWCAAWSIAFEDRAHVVSVHGRVRHCARSPEAALSRFRIGSHITTRLVWVNPDAATSTPED